MNDVNVKGRYGAKCNILCEPKTFDANFKDIELAGIQIRW
jgi:hypothetical protein